MKDGKIVSDIDVHAASLSEINEKMSLIYDNINVTECTDAKGNVHRIVLALDAEAVITFFRMTGRKHIFITGSRGSGKSHLVNNMLKYMSDSFNLLQSHRTDTPQVVFKSNLVADYKDLVIGVPRTS